MSVNFILGDFVSQWRVAKLSFVKFAILRYNSTMILPVIKILYDNGIIRGFKISDNNKIIIYFKYYQNNICYYNIKIISTPGHRIRWSLSQLSLHYNQNSFSGFYIISTKYGLKTSTDCLFNSRIGGEVLLKVEL